MNDSTRIAHETIRRHSKSFALAAALLPRATARDAVVLYAYCRKADDAIDLAPPIDSSTRLRALRADLDAMYDSRPLEDPILGAMQELVSRRRIPRTYLDDLLDGLEMDTSQAAYESFADLVTYGYRVAGTVGLMMCHVMGVRDCAALAHAAHLGIAMQLTNVARDVHEDWERGRLYLPDDVLARAGAGGLRARLGGPFPRDAVAAVRAATAELLDRADGYYRSGDLGTPHLSMRCALAVRTARLVYSRIGGRIRARGCDPLAPRAVVPRLHKLWLATRAALETTIRAPLGALRPRPRTPDASFEFRPLASLPAP